jgi:hypothetical protein
MPDSIEPRRMSDETIARALDHHRDRGVISGWSKLSRPERWVINLTGTGLYHRIEARTKREVGLVLAALTSAEYAARPTTRAVIERRNAYGARLEEPRLLKSALPILVARIEELDWVLGRGNS